jgi:Acyl-CoA dehydrogenase, N-terminal domain
MHAGIGQPKPLPVPNSDFCELAGTLNAEELAAVKQVRAFMERKVAPIINKYRADDAFPFELLPALKELNIGGLGLQGYGRRGGSQKLFGFVAMEIARVALHLLRRPQQAGDGLHLPQRIGGAETEVAAADGAPRKDRLFRPDRAAGGFGNRRRHDDDSQARRHAWILNGQKK